MDSRVLLSTFGGSGGLGRAAISIVGHRSAGEHASPDHAKRGASIDARRGAPAPSFTATAVSTTQINLEWNRVAGARRYLVDESVNGAWTQIGSMGGRTTSDTIDGLSPGTTYDFRVSAFKAKRTLSATDQSATTLAPPTAYHGATTLAPPATVQGTTTVTPPVTDQVTTRITPPAAPSFTATAVSATEIDLSWGGVAGATSYLVDEWANGAWTQIGSLGGGTTSCTVNGLSPGTTYSFEVGASNTAGTTWASPQSATTLAPPAAPSFTATAVSATEIDLSWGGVAGATSYLVDEWASGAWTQIGSVGGGTTSCTVNGLSPGTTYSFDVGASNAIGTTWASSQSATTLQRSVVVDHPAALADYSPVNGSLFGASGPSYFDVHQGDVGDCWLLASLAEVAARAPSIIENMFTYDGTGMENGSVVGIYTVRLFNNAGTAEYVTVDTELPAGGGFYDHPFDGVLWVALAEKAYAEANGDGFVTTSDMGSDSYAALDGGDPSWALHAITGEPEGDYSISPFNIGIAWNLGDFIVLTTNAPPSSYIVGDHCYAVVGYNGSSSQPFEVFNPWGTDSSGWVPGYSNRIYGLFTANAAFVSQNFVGQSIGVGSAAGLDDHAYGPQEGADVLSALDQRWFRHGRTS